MGGRGAAKRRAAKRRKMDSSPAQPPIEISEQERRHLNATVLHQLEFWEGARVFPDHKEETALLDMISMLPIHAQGALRARLADLRSIERGSEEDGMWWCPDCFHIFPTVNHPHECEGADDGIDIPLQPKVEKPSSPSSLCIKSEEPPGVPCAVKSEPWTDGTSSPLKIECHRGLGPAKPEAPRPPAGQRVITDFFHGATRKKKQEEATGESGSAAPPAPKLPVPQVVDSRKMDLTSDKQLLRAVKQRVESLKGRVDPVLAVKGADSVLFALHANPLGCSSRSTTFTCRPADLGSSRVLLLPVRLADPTSPAAWPEMVMVSGAYIQYLALAVNGISVPPPANWRVREGDHFKTFIPIDITRYLTTAADGVQRLDLELHREQERWKAGLIGVVADCTPISELVEHVLRQEGQARAAMECDMEATVSLRCPLTGLRMAVPGRGKSCEHIECFDVASFISHCSAMHLWTCPVCLKPTPFDQIVVFPTLLEAVRNAPEQATAVWIESNGEWRPVLPQPRGVEYLDVDVDVDEVAFKVQSTFAHVQD
eukprot:Sspe_Gene.31775::Locus_15637_Transcript_2_2_Confidence_0.400_Length_1711::g.31775::m.31775